MNGQGFVELHAQGAANRLEASSGYFEESTVSLMALGKSLAIRLSVPPVDRFASIEAEEAKVLEAIDAACELLHHFKSYHVVL